MSNQTYRRILVATDFSAQTAAIIERAVSLQRKFNCQLELIHIVEIPVYPVLEDMAVMGAPGLWNEEIAQNVLESANNKLANLANQYAIEDYKVLSGLASVDICEHAKQSGADLIVIGSHGVSGWRRLIGSTTNAVVNHAECDVTLVRSKENK